MTTAASVFLSVVNIKRRDQEGVTVDCPFCGQEHTHRGCGYNVALCGQGHYSAITPMPGQSKAE